VILQRHRRNCHDIRGRVQHAVDRIVVTAQILRTEGAEGFTPQIDLLSTGQRVLRRIHRSRMAVKTEHFGVLATAIEPSCGVQTVADELMLLRLNGSASSFCKSSGPQWIPECGL
jgi:hypothetical protein